MVIGLDAGMAAWRLDALWQRLEPLWPGLQVQWLPEVGSTNTALLDAARRGDGGPCLLVAQRQTAGRGRLGREWQSQWSGGNDSPPVLTASLRVSLAAADLSGLSLAVGLALAEALDARVGVKWPNDLVVPVEGADPVADPAGDLGRKLCGILIETVPVAADRGRVVVIGFGLNIAPPPPDNSLHGQATGLVTLDPAATAASALDRVGPALLQALRQFEHGGFAALRARYAARDRLAGRTVRVLQSGGAAPLHEGRAVGVDEQGFLMVETSAGVQRIGSGEVSVRPC